MQATTDKQGWIRWVANCLQLPGYYLLIHNTFEVGLAIKAFSDVLLNASVKADDGSHSHG